MPDTKPPVITDDEWNDIILFFQERDGALNCERHPLAALKRGRQLIAEVVRLRNALGRIHACAYDAEETSKTWCDVSREQTDIARTALNKS